MFLRVLRGCDEALAQPFNLVQSCELVEQPFYLVQGCELVEQQMDFSRSRQVVVIESLSLIHSGLFTILHLIISKFSQRHCVSRKRKT